MGSVQIPIPENVSKKIRNWCTEKLNKSDIFEIQEHDFGEGIQVCKGLDEKNLPDIIAKVAKCRTIVIPMANLQVESEKEYDVLQLRIEKTFSMRWVYKTLVSFEPNDLEREQFFLTLAYLKKGRGNGLLEKERNYFSNTTFTVRFLDFVDQKGKKTKLALN